MSEKKLQLVAALPVPLKSTLHHRPRGWPINSRLISDTFAFAMTTDVAGRSMVPIDRRVIDGVAWVQLMALTDSGACSRR